MNECRGRSGPFRPDVQIKLAACLAVDLISLIMLASEYAGSQVREGHLVNALAMRGDERRGTLRKASGRREHPLIRRSLNGATHP